MRSLTNAGDQPTSPTRYWTPPKKAITRDSVPEGAIPADLEARVAALTLPDVIDIALLNNPQTRIAYATARAAGEGVGVAYSRFLPQIVAGLPFQRQHTSGTNTSTNVSSSGTFSLLTPNVSVSWLLLSFGRQATIDQAQYSAYAAAYNFNAAVQQVILAVQQAFFDYNAAKAIRDGQSATVSEAKTNLDAARARHEAGLATLSDVLLAQTAYSRAELQLITDEGAVQTTRGALAIAIGVPATIPYDVQADPNDLPIGPIAESVDSLVQRAVQTRPDLAALRAQAKAARANVTVARSLGLPTLSLNGAGSKTYNLETRTTTGNAWNAQLAITIPIFQGFQTYFETRLAREQAKAAQATAESQRDLVVTQVFTAYYNLRTATAQVKVSDDLLISSQRSYDVAIGMYRAGVGNILDVLTAEAALASARSQQIQSRWAWASSLSQVSFAVGILGIRGQPGLRVERDTSLAPARIAPPAPGPQR